MQSVYEGEKPVQYSSYPGKRAFDIIFALLTLILFSPLLLLVAIAVTLDSGWPILFRHDRLGLFGNSFTCLKFRSMCPDAEDRLNDDPELFSRYLHNSFKLKSTDHPRLTRIGGFLRRSSLDELPQLWNILKGDMSVVGPRPIIPIELQ
ncbi:sugar transferase, partial [bacterium]|nr:sugar transferase [bacterium]